MEEEHSLQEPQVRGRTEAPAGEDAANRLASRRQLFKLSAAAVAGGAVASILAPTPALAGGADSPMVTDEPNLSDGPPNVTSIYYTSGGGSLGGLFQAALLDWGGQLYNVMAYGATGNGSTDDTAAIQAAQAAAGAGCVYFPLGTYLVDGLTIATQGQTFKLESGATLRAKTGIGGPVVTVTAPDVSILGPGTIDGNTANPQTSGLDCILFQRDADDGLVQGIVAQNAAWIGIHFEDAQRARVLLNRVIDCAQTGIAVAATNTVVSGTMVMGNEVTLDGGSVLTGINVIGANATQVVNYASVVANWVVVNSGIAYQIYECQYTLVKDNFGQGPEQVFSMAGGVHNLVSGNTAVPNGAGVGIELSSNHSSCVGNTVTQTGTGSGIHANSAAGTHVVISDNVIDGAYDSGIGVDSYDHVVITGNVVHQSPSASSDYGVIRVAPVSPGLIVIADNVCDAASASSWGIWLQNLVSGAIQTTIHDNVITGLPAPGSPGSPSAIRLDGTGALTDLLVHDNSVSSDSTFYSLAPGLTLGNNVRFHHNIVVGVPVPGLSPVTLPASGSPYTNTSPVEEIIYIQGGKLTGSGAAQGVVKNGFALVKAGTALKTPLSVVLEPGESITVYYSTTPAVWKDVKI